MADEVSTTTGTIPEPPAPAISVTTLFAAFVPTLSAFIRTKCALCCGADRDRAADATTLAADAALAATRAACEAMIAAPAMDEADRALQGVARLYLRVIRSGDPQEIAGLRAHMRLRRWAWLMPDVDARSRELNLWIGATLDTREAWLFMEDDWRTLIEGRDGPNPGGDIGAGPSA